MAKDYAKDFYNSMRWRKLSKAYAKSKHYICERCGRPGRIVHHIRYITPTNINDPEITLNWENLKYLCQDCHTTEHMSSPACQDGLKFDDQGNLTKV